MLIPHILKQEVEAGKNVSGSIYGENSATDEEQARTSPHNFHYYFQNATYQEDLSENVKIVTVKEGDCLFMPAFYFYHMAAGNLNGENVQLASFYYMRTSKDKENRYMASVVSLEFQSNSHLLQGIFDAVEKGILN